LAEDYPEQFARWLFGAVGTVKVEKTELDREPSARRCRHLFERRERNAARRISDDEEQRFQTV
jgi:hypothetical protein